MFKRKKLCNRLRVLRVTIANSENGWMNENIVGRVQTSAN